MDRLSNLPHTLLLEVLSWLPTKDAVVMCSVSKRMKHAFPSIPSLDFDDSPISFCQKRPHKTTLFPLFVSFVTDNILAYQPRNISTFRLQVGRKFVTKYFRGCKICKKECGKRCIPILEFPLLDFWLRFPFTRLGLRELDLCFWMRNSSNSVELPQEIFLCETLEVLKIDVVLSLRQISAMPSFRLPKLTLLHLRALLLIDNGFLTRLVSDCPLLEDLSVEAWFTRIHNTSITSPSIRRLSLIMHQRNENQEKTSALINAPNLQYLKYNDDLASHYSVPKMDSLVKAVIDIANKLGGEEIEVSFQQMLSLMRPLSNVRHLSLLGLSVQILDFVEVQDQLPMFRNLKHLVLDYDHRYCYWDQVLAILNCSPVLKTILFAQRMVFRGGNDAEIIQRRVLEREFFRTTPVIPACCMSHLKRIEIKNCYSSEREINLMKFLLRHAWVLEDLLVYMEDRYFRRSWFENSLKRLPRASIVCSIQVIEWNDHMTCSS